MDWLRFYVPLDTKYVISETFFLANVLASGLVLEKLYLTQQKQTTQEQSSLS